MMLKRSRYLFKALKNKDFSDLSERRILKKCIGLRFETQFRLKNLFLSLKAVKKSNEDEAFFIKTIKRFMNALAPIKSDHPEVIAFPIFNQLELRYYRQIRIMYIVLVELMSSSIE